MTDLDRTIDEALDAEERELLRSIEEPGFFGEAIGVFAGPSGWANAAMMAAQAALFVAGVWTAWHFFEAGDPASQLRWGLPAAVLLILSLSLKLALIPRMEANRVIRELKRLELRIAAAGRR